MYESRPVENGMFPGFEGGGVFVAPTTSGQRNTRGRTLGVLSRFRVDAFEDVVQVLREDLKVGD